MLCYSEARNPVSHALVHNSPQVYFQLFFVVFIRKSYKSTPLQSIKHQHPTGSKIYKFSKQPCSLRTGNCVRVVMDVVTQLVLSRLPK